MNHTLQLLDDSVARVLKDTVSHRSTLEAERTGLDEAAWRQLNEIGLVGTDASVMSMAELAIVIEAVATAGALVPYADSEALGRWLAGGADMDTDTEVLAIAPIVDAGARVRIDNGAAQLEIHGMSIPWACRAEKVLFSFRSGSRCLVAAKDVRELALRRTPNLAGEPHGIVVSQTIEVDAKDVREVSAARSPEAIIQRGALCRSVQMLGAMTRVNELTLQYSRDRKQFKRSLSDFQVIQSYLAAMAGELCASAAIVQTAIEAATGDDAFEAIAAAKVRTGQAARQITSLGHQVHGAIGFTQEYPLNLWTRRLWAWREEYGNEAQWAADLGARLIARGADALWPHLTQQTSASHD
jgi:acyl-CoA dehydrogenase